MPGPSAELFGLWARPRYRKSPPPTMLRGFLLLICIAFLSVLGAQQDSTRLAKLLTDYKVKTSIGLQLWATYSQNMRVYDESTGLYVKADNRLNAQIRRSRFIITGQPYERLNFNITAALDLVGHDVLAATQTGGNNGASPLIRLWNAFLQYQVSKRPDRLYVVAGYFPPPVGRESSTAALRSNSFEKAWSQNYVRRQLTGTGPGRATGLLLAGQLHDVAPGIHLSYETALQNPVFQAYAGNSTGLQFSPLWSTRLSVYVGDLENEKYSLVHRVNYFGKRDGLTLSVSGARQGQTDAFGSNRMLGFELLYNTAGLHIDGDYHFFRRNTPDGDATTRTKGRTGYLRVGYNIDAGGARVLEPVVSYWFLRSPTTVDGIANAALTQSFSGSDLGIDIGANLYFNPDFKLSLFYAYRKGDEGEGRPQDINNNYFQQTGVGPVMRGSYFGAGWVVLF